MSKRVQKLDGYMSVTEAAYYLGVVTNTLRNWERLGKIKVHRNPMNNYRMYRKDELDEIHDKMYPKTRKIVPTIRIEVSK